MLSRVFVPAAFVAPLKVMRNVTEVWFSMALMALRSKLARTKVPAVGSNAVKVPTVINEPPLTL